MKNIKLGYEINTGHEITINPSHLVVTGITQESGKTTTLEALIHRGKYKAIIFKTKPGEKGIINGKSIMPFFKEEYDWEYTRDLLQASTKEKLKFELSWIIKYSKTASSLIEFKANIDNAIAKDSTGEKKIRDLERSVLIVLQAYLEKILPELQFSPLSSTLELHDGINIMDLEKLKEETQALIIRSVLDEVLRNFKNIIVVIPECWKFLPQGVGNPVKRPAGKYIRQGASNNNFLWMDSQDITGVDKSILKQVSTWILGIQRETNEIQRTLDQIPLAKRQRPKPEEIASLQLGHFFVATKEFTKKIYVQPSWLSDDEAKKIALGQILLNDIKKPEVKIESIEFQKKLSMDKKDDVWIRKEINEIRTDFFNKINELDLGLKNLYQKIYNIDNLNIDDVVSKVLQKIPLNNHQIDIDIDQIVQNVIAKIPNIGSAVVYNVSPIEKIKKDFLENAKNKILDDIKQLDDQQKTILKWIEQHGKQTIKKDIFLNCFGKSSTSGNTYQNLVKKVTYLKQIEIIRVDTAQRIYPFLKERIKNLISQYDASDSEIDQVYNHILFEML